MIAIWDESDQWHVAANAAYALLFSQGRKLVTTSFSGNAATHRLDGHIVRTYVTCEGHFFWKDF